MDPGEPDLIVETDETNHIQTVNVTVGGAAAINLLSFEHDDGTFFSGDPVHMRLKYQHTGTAAVPVNQVNNIRIVLSRDNSNIGADDFILRTINASGNNHGTPLHSGETVSMDWVQTLPGNLNGTFFVLAELNGTIMPADHSPSLSIFSSTNGETSLPMFPPMAIRPSTNRELAEPRKSSFVEKTIHLFRSQTETPGPTHPP